MTARDLVPIRRALLSVSDKRGLLELARALTSHSVELVSTGGTARALRDGGFAVTDVAAVTGFPEIMGGRVKTLHPLVHGALLARDGVDDDALAAHAITPIDLLVVNLYPFEQATADPACDLELGIENIDIGGPAMLRAAAKNHARVAVVVDPADYAHIVAALPAGTTLAQRRLLAARSYAHTARYDGRIADWLGGRAAGAGTAFGPTLHLAFERGVALRYGENPHQAGALYLEPGAAPGTVAAARVLQGKEVSYNNIADGDAALQCVKQFDAPACVIVKHANPCGVATGEDPGAAYDRAYATDPQSAFGGVIAFNRALDADTARRVLERQFVEMVLAPEVLPEALAAFGAKAKVRVLATGAWSAGAGMPARDYRRVAGGLLVQDADADCLRPGDFEIVSRRAPDAAELGDLHFAWKVAMYVKSNAIVYAREGRTIGIGAGQMSRVTSARIAALKAVEAGLEVRGSVMASDAFFPFRDGIDAAAEAGIRAVIQPGGSMRDREVIAAADEHGMAMVFTKVRHFRH